MKGMRLLLVVPLLVFGSMAVEAQEPPTLDRIEELARLGRTEEARDALRVWWSDVGPKASRRDTQRGLWLRGRLTPDPAGAALDFQRLVVEYPGGPFSVMALLRLAQAAYAAGDSATAAESVERLSREYPASPVRREAEAWLATAGPVPRRAAGAEPKAAAPQAEPSAAPAPSPTDAPPPAPAGGPGSFTVQLGAFSTVSRAETVLARLAEAGLEGRLARVPGSDLIRVRVGTFDSAEGANAVLWQLRDLGFTAVLARDAHLEEPVVR